MVKTALTLSMTPQRSPFDPRFFGRRRPFQGEAVAVPAPSMSEDMKLFAMTYVAGFVFVSLYLL
jgi:hypothetical protein